MHPQCIIHTTPVLGEVQDDHFSLLSAVAHAESSSDESEEIHRVRGGGRPIRVASCCPGQSTALERVGGLTFGMAWHFAENA